VEEKAEERVNNSVKRTERGKKNPQNVKSRNRARTDGRGGGRRGSLVTKRSGRKGRGIEEHDGSTFVVK